MNRSEAVLLTAILGCSVLLPVVVGLTLMTLNFASPTAPVWVWIWGWLVLGIVVTHAVFIGLNIAHRRAKRDIVPDGPEADYVDPAA